MQYQWAEDDFDLPDGVGRLDLPAPVSDKKYVMYHGTTRQSAQSILATGFRQSADGMLGPGVYLSRDLQKASRYPINHPEYDKVVIRVEVNVGKVIAINRQGHPRQKTWHDSRYGNVYDTAWVPPGCGMVRSDLEEDCVWDPNQIKIMSTITPRPVQPCFGYGAWGYIHLYGISFQSLTVLIKSKVNSQPALLEEPGESDTETNMSYQWAEDDFDVPCGVYLLGLDAPASGESYVMYHGTSRQNAQSILATGFQQSPRGLLGRGVYLSRDLEKASGYPMNHPEYDKVVIKVVVSVGEVITIDYQGHPRQKTWHDSRYGPVYDTACVPPGCGMVRNPLEVDCVWDPNRIQIISTIKPRPVRSSYGYGAHGYKCHRFADGMLGRGIYLSRDLQKAHDPRYGPVYDTAWVPPGCGMVRSDLEEDCVWDPTQIKIMSTIIPRPVQACFGYGAWGYILKVLIKSKVNSQPALLEEPGESDTETNMQYQWAEDDFDVPCGVVRLGLSEPVNNRQYVMYHGTTRQSALFILATGFQQSEDGMLGPGVYLSRDLQKASRYPIDHPEYDKVVIKVVVSVGKVIAINYQGHPCQKTWHDFGYDTAWVPPGCGMVRSGLEENCVWDPSRIQIIGAIKPRPVQAFFECSPWGHMFSSQSLTVLIKSKVNLQPALFEEPGESDTETNMSYQWAEDDFDLPRGVGRLGLSEPVNNRQYVMYHGTTRKAAQSILARGFEQSAGGMLGPGVYLSRDLEKASRYPIDHPESDRVVIRVEVNVGKVIAINRQGHPRQKNWHDSRYGPVYDTAWVPPGCGMVRSDLEEDCVWDPSQIQIISTIKPSPVQASGGYGARGYK
ncbi:uncharacterized protein LOC122869497 [Siniperca chuatsi]|nr:uncharacterized protein LOC122869497 [Siniperca chuatsi]